jgi:hypothetical protein
MGTMPICDRLRITFYCICIFFVSCSTNKENGLVVEETRLLDSIPSGSGIVIRNDSAYLIGDDATGLYHVNLNDLQFRKIALPGFSNTEFREPKDTKRDFESLAIVRFENDHLIAFGSGSKSLIRDSILLVNLEIGSPARVMSIQPLYKNLQQITRTDGLQWNIEGATVAGDYMFLCNRGNNMIIQFPKQYLLSSPPFSTLPAVKTFQVKLPSIGNREARLSGMCTIDESHLLFTASVEDTDDWIKDGPVLGSYLAVYSLKTNKIISAFLLKDAYGKPLLEKLESVDIREKQSNGELKLIAVGDNDNGSTKIFRLSLRLNQD